MNTGREILNRMEDSHREQMKINSIEHNVLSINELKKQIKIESEKTLEQIQSNSKTQNKQYRNTLIVSILTLLVAVGSLCVSIFCR